MPTRLLELPAEILLHIFNRIGNWDDRNALASVDGTLWNVALRLRNVETYALGRSINALQVAVSRCIAIPTPVVLCPRLLIAIVKSAHAAERLVVLNMADKERASVKTAKRLLYNVNRYHESPRQLQIMVPEALKDIWTRAYQETFEKTPKGETLCLGFIDNDGNDVPEELDLDGYETPDETHQAALQIKRQLKHAAVISGRAKLRHTASNAKSFIPGFVSREQQRLLDIQPNLYTEASSTLLEDQLPTFIHDRHSIQQMVQRVAQQHVESIVFFDRCWFLLTSLDAFADRAYDDCSNYSDQPFQETLTASITPKAYMGGKEFYELSLYIGNVELLAVGGFWGVCGSNDVHPFLGSSIPNLPRELQSPQSTERIMTLIHSPRTSTSIRLLRQYIKQQASCAWSFHSYRFTAQHFYPANPLHFKAHASKVTIYDKPSMIELASFALRGVVTPELYSRIELLDAMVLARQIKQLAPFFEEQGAQATFACLHKKAKEEASSHRTLIPTSGILSILEDVASQNDLDEEGIKAISLVAYHKELREYCTTIMNSVLSKKVKATNAKIIEKYKLAHLR